MLSLDNICFIKGSALFQSRVIILFVNIFMISASADVG